MRTDKKNIDEKIVPENKGQKSLRRSKKRKTFIILAILAIVCAAVLIGGYCFLLDKFNNMDYEDLTGADFDINTGVDEKLEGYRNILIVGLDTRENEDEAYSKSDAIIIATINEDTGKVRLTSVYRDTLLDLEEHEGEHKLDKLTHQYMYGGPLALIKTLNRNMDLNIKEYVKVNWETVADAADNMGGLELTIKDYEIKEMNKFIKSTNKTLHGDKTKIKKAGKQTLNGIQTVTYCRIRKVGNGDYERTERMRKTMKAAFKKTKTMSIVELNDLADETLPEIGTNITGKKMVRLAIGALRYDLGKNSGWPYDVSEAVVDGVWYGPPVTLESNVKEMHRELFGQKNYEPTKKVKNINDRIIEFTGVE